MNQLVGLTKEIKSCLNFLSEFGNSGVECSEKSLHIVRSWDLSAVFLDMIVCKDCRLAEYKKRTIHGMGDAKADLMVICGRPESEDARTGVPFSGKEGELLDRILSAMNLSRESVYITPAVKCCAPDAPDAAAENIKPCKSHLLKEIEFIQPKIICTFGHLASMALLGIPLPIHRLRGRFHTFQGIRIMPTYSLGHLLKYPQDKRAAWEDIKLVMRESASSG